MKLPFALRRLFGHILIYNEPADPKKLWDEFKEHLAEDFIYHAGPGEQAKEEAIKRAYRIIACHIENNATEGRRFSYWVKKFGMDDVDQFVDELQNQVLPPDEAMEKGVEDYGKLNDEQRKAVDEIMASIRAGRTVSNCFYIDGAGGTGKTFLYTTLYHLMRGEGFNVTNMASTGIASTLLSEGATAHKTFNLAVPLQSNSTSRIKPGTNKAEHLKTIDAFFLDEAPMLPKYGIENIDEKLRELHITAGSNGIPFAGTVQIYGGDFRQLLPVQPRAIRSELVDLSIKRSHLWNNFRVFRLKKNQRVDPDEREFADYILKASFNIQFKFCIIDG